MMLAFLTKKVQFFRYISNIFLFSLRLEEKYVIFVIPSKDKIIYDAESINMWILADEACPFTNVSNITP